MKRTFTLILALCSLLSIGAKEISEKQAASIADKLRSAVATRSVSNAKVQLTRVANSQATLAYVFNYSGDNGFVIVSGDDRVGEVLAYSPSGKFDLDNLAPATKAWLNAQKSVVEAVMNGSVVLADNTTTTDVYDTAVEPLCTSKWGQSAPYYNLCPTKKNSKGEDEHVVTGCVATAMAQVLYYWKQPASGEGNNIISVDDKWYYVDFSESVYDWTNMTDTYDTTSTEASQTAVAKLMYDCGVAVNMLYDLSENGGSAAYDYEEAKALVNYFKMDKGIKVISAECYRNFDEWQSVIKSELDAKRPVLYGGSDPAEGGHAFVCDGYDKSALFHINWGWNGQADGYYSLRTLLPVYKGVKLLENGFCVEQSAIIGIKPAEEGSVAIPYTLGLNALALTVADNAKKLLNIEVSGLINVGYGDFEGKIGVGIYDSTGKRVFEELSDEKLGIDVGSAIDNLETGDLDMSKLANGEYSVHLYTVDSNGHEELVAESRCFFPETFTISDEGLTVNNPKGAVIEPVSIDAVADEENGGTIKAQLKVTNENADYEYYGLLQSYFVDDMELMDKVIESESAEAASRATTTTGEAVKGSVTNLNLAPGKSTSDINLTVSGVQSKSGYFVVVNSSTGEVVYYSAVTFSSTGIANIEAASDGTITIVDLQGRKVFSGKSSVEAATSGLASGVYVVKSGNSVSKILVK